MSGDDWNGSLDLPENERLDLGLWMIDDEFMRDDAQGIGTVNIALFEESEPPLLDVVFEDFARDIKNTILRRRYAKILLEKKSDDRIR